jgi:hypothetical protein
MIRSERLTVDAGSSGDGDDRDRLGLLGTSDENGAEDVEVEGLGTTGGGEEDCALVDELRFRS